MKTVHSIPAFTLDCLMLTMIFYLILSRLGLPILLFWTQYKFWCHLITTFIMSYYLSKLQKPDFFIFKWDTQCLSPVFIGVIIFLPFSLPMYEYDSWPNPTAKILFLLLFLLKSPRRILSLQALLSFPILTQNPFSSTEMKVISPTHLFSTQLMSPTKPFMRKHYLLLWYSRMGICMLSLPLAFLH